MSVNWTDEQKKAIETTDKGVVVPAAAGSGKTAVLIERTVRLLEDPNADVPAEKLLAVTFTKDAANQMRNKLREALAQRLAQENDEARREWLSRQQEMLPLAKISTINSFCLELVKDNLNEFDYRNGIKICDDTQAKTLLDESLTEAMELMYEESRERAELLIDALTDNNQKELGKYIEQMYRFRRSLAFPDEWTEKTQKMLQSTAYTDELIGGIMGELDKELDNLYKLCDEEMFVCGKMFDNNKYVSCAASDREIIDGFKPHLMHGDVEKLYEVCLSCKFGTVPRISVKNLDGEQKITQQQLYDEFKSIRDKLKDSVKNFTAKIIEIGSDPYTPMKDSAYIFAALIEAADKLDKCMNIRKLEQGLAQFGDVERMAMDLLVKKQDGQLVRTELAEHIRNERTYRVMLIDEYQDVNNLQEMIFRALSDTDDLNVLGKNVFVVGDVKQSIYRFRLSNPKLFLNAVENARDEKYQNLCEIRLTKNFRSRQNVLSFVNMLFRRLMSKQLGELDYTNDEQLYLGANYPDEDPPVELIMIEENQDTDEELKYLIFGEEELACARRIKDVLDEGRIVSDGKEQRPCRPSDFCVLSRNKAALRKISAALEYVRLHAQSEQTDGYMGSREIVTMVELLRVIDNPMRDLSMAAVMLSPVMQFTAQELATLRTYCYDQNGKQIKRLHQVLTAASKQDDADEKEAEKIDLGDALFENKCRRAVELTARLRFYSVSMTLEELIVKIYDETNFFAVASIYENAKQKRANLRLLTQMAAEYEHDSTGGIAGFLRFLDSVNKSGKDFAQAVTVTAGDDSINVKTFHGSKGLEFPFVFLLDLGRAFNLSDINSRLLLNEQMGAGINFMRHDLLMKVKTPAHSRLADITQAEILSEELRLLYVALTRAKEQLFIPIFLKHNRVARFDFVAKLQTLADNIAAAGGASPQVLKNCSTNAEWICAALMLSDAREKLLDAIDRSDLAEQFKSFSPVDDLPPKMQWLDGNTDTAATAETVAFTMPQPDSAVVADLRRKYEFHFPESETLAASKRTVTEIVTEIRRKNESDEKSDMMFYPQLGSLNEEAKRLTSAQRGTYTHLFMELADYELAEIDVKVELLRLVTKGMLSEVEAKGVYLDAVRAFFKSDFYSRMKASDEIRREMKFMVRADDSGISQKYSEFISNSGMIQGICDCIFREDDGYVLVDYKTDGFTDISELDKYKVQLDLYKSALDLILPMPVKACYIYSFKLRTGKMLDL